MKQSRQQRYLRNKKLPKHPKNKTALTALRISWLIENTGSKRHNTRNRTVWQSISTPIFEDLAEAVVRKSVGDRVLHVVREGVRYGKPGHSPKIGDTVDYIKYFYYNPDTMTYTHYRAYLGDTGNQYGVNAIHDVTNNKWIPVVGNDKLLKAMKEYHKERNQRVRPLPGDGKPRTPHHTHK